MRARRLTNGTRQPRAARAQCFAQSALAACKPWSTCTSRSPPSFRRARTSACASTVEATPPLNATTTRGRAPVSASNRRATSSGSLRFTAASQPHVQIRPQAERDAQQHAQQQPPEREARERGEEL